MKQTIIIIALMCAMTVSCADMAQDRLMSANIVEWEAELDNWAQKIPFDDTVGEGDSYVELCMAFDNFKKAEPGSKQRIEAYNKYKKMHTKVIKECIDVDASIKEERGDE